MVVSEESLVVLKEPRVPFPLNAFTTMNIEHLHSDIPGYTVHKDELKDDIMASRYSWKYFLKLLLGLKKDLFSQNVLK